MAQLALATKVCRHCGVEKGTHEFHRTPAAPDGLRPDCADCRNARQKGYYGRLTDDQRRRHKGRVLKYKYGVTLDELDAMYEAQNGRCAICQAEGPRPAEGDMPGRGYGRALDIDHDHATGRVRALLCKDCNLGIGRFSDDPEKLESAAQYLRRHGKGDRPSL